MFFTGSCCDWACVQPASTVATAKIPANRVLVIFFIVCSLQNGLLLASFLNFGVAGTLLGWCPLLSLRGHERREGLLSPRTHFQGAAAAFFLTRGSRPRRWFPPTRRIRAAGLRVSRAPSA